MTFFAVHREVERVLHANAPPARVFPLLCPVREREWVEGWEAEVLHSKSGLAEMGCVFVARVAGHGETTYVVTRYEPPKRIEFALFARDRLETLSIELRPAREGTDMTWRRTYTGLSVEGNAWIEAHVPDSVGERLTRLEAMMNRFLAATSAPP